MTYRITLEYAPEDESAKVFLAEHEVSAEVAITLLAAIVSATPKVENTTEEPEAEEEPKVAPKRGRPKKAGGRFCAECGSVGVRHRKTCSRNKPKQDTERANSGALLESEFDHIKQTQEDGEMISSEYAREHKLPVREVNLAIFADDYEDYLREREKSSS